MASFTPGPWEANVECNGYVFAGDLQICDCDFPQGELSRDDIRDNANLIAAAPELLAACHNAAAMLAVAQSGTRADAGQQKELGVKWQSTEDAIAGVLAELRAAIAKATT